MDRFSSAWAHVAFCADPTWAPEPPDEFTITNQRLWTLHCRVSKVLQGSTLELQNALANDCDLSDNKRPAQKENSNTGKRSVKEVIPESRLARFYGNFYYEDARERCYTNTNERTSVRDCMGQEIGNSDITECWMLPEVEYWFRKLLEEKYRTIYPAAVSHTASERSGSNVPRNVDEEAALAARVQNVRTLWSPVRRSPPRVYRPPSPPPVSRKIRARRRQPRLLALAPPPPAYCLEVPAHLFCDPSCKFQFDPPRPPHLVDYHKAMGRLRVSEQVAIRASAMRCPPYRGTNISRYAPTGQRPARCPDRRYGVWWPRDHPSPRLNHKLQLTHIQYNDSVQKALAKAEAAKTETNEEKVDSKETVDEELHACQEEDSPKQDEVVDDELPSTSAAAVDTGLRKKRLYSTVLSMCAPTPINLTPVVRLAHKLVTPEILKLNRVLPNARIRTPNVDHKFEELEKEALEQYKASDESIDTKFQELEKQAVEQEQQHEVQ